MKKAMFSILLAGLFLGALTGCQKKIQSDENAQKTAHKKTEISIWSSDRHDVSYIQDKIKDYNEQQDDITVSYEVYTDDYEQAVSLAAQDGKLPDILKFQDQIYYDYLEKGQWLDMLPYMDDHMRTYFQDVIYDGYNQIDGKLYYIPTCGTTARLFYNKDVFAKAGIADPPATMEEMLQDARIITEKLSGEGIYGFAQNMKSAREGLNRSLDNIIELEQGVKGGYDFARQTYDFTVYQPALECWKELLSDKCAFPGCESLEIDPLRVQFQRGKIGMYFSWTHSEPAVYQQQFPMDSSQWDVAPIPTSQGTQKGKQNIVFTSAYLINAKSKNAQKAFQVYKDIFTDEDFLMGYTQSGYGISIIPQIMDNAQLEGDFKNKPYLLMQDTDQVLPLTPGEKNPEAIAQTGSDYYKTLESILYGNKDASEALMQITKEYTNVYGRD